MLVLRCCLLCNLEQWYNIKHVKNSRKLNWPRYITRLLGDCCKITTHYTHIHIIIYTMNRINIPKCFLIYSLQNLTNCDKLWYVLSWVNLSYRNVNVFRMTWIHVASLPYLVKLSRTVNLYWWVWLSQHYDPSRDQWRREAWACGLSPAMCRLAPQWNKLVNNQGVS